MRDDVGERDGNEAAEKRVGQVAVVVHDPRCDPHGDDVGERDEPDHEQEARERDEAPDHVGERRRALDHLPRQLRAHLDRPVVGLAEAVEGDRAEHDRDERERPRPCVEVRKAGERPAGHQAPVSFAEGRDAGEQAEVDGEALPVLRPFVAAVREHREPGHEAVEDDRDRDRARVAVVPVRELEGREGEQEDGARPAPPPLRVRERRLPAEPGALRDPGGGVGGRPPRAQHGPDVAEERAERRHAQPEVDEDEPWGEVVVGRRVADRGGHEDEDEEGERGGAEEDPQELVLHTIASSRGTGRPRLASARSGRCQSAQRARNETTRTMEAPQ